MDYYQQGDVYLVPVEEIPGDAKEVKPGIRGHVLAEGEETGHAHRIADVEKAVLLTDQYSKMFIEIFDAVELKHEEHHIQTIPTGKYEVRRVLEYDHFAEEARRVQD